MTEPPQEWWEQRTHTLNMAIAAADQARRGFEAERARYIRYRRLTWVSWTLFTVSILLSINGLVHAL